MHIKSSLITILCLSILQFATAQDIEVSYHEGRTYHTQTIDGVSVTLNFEIREIEKRKYFWFNLFVKNEGENTVHLLPKNVTGDLVFLDEEQELETLYYKDFLERLNKVEEKQAKKEAKKSSGEVVEATPYRYSSWAIADGDMMASAEETTSAALEDLERQQMSAYIDNLDENHESLQHALLKENTIPPEKRLGGVLLAKYRRTAESLVLGVPLGDSSAYFVIMLED